MRWHLLFCLGIVFIIHDSLAKDPVSPDPEFDEILSRDISDLDVTSAGKRSQLLKDTAAAVYVITQEDIRRAGIYSIPEALRLAPGVQVARLSSNRWAVSARGFNGGLSNKLLVLLDGRTIYSPVFSGVYWDDQSTAINDIERIEVIRGPGASLYGANAVNGVINIITRSAEDTQGNMVSATVTQKGTGVYEARHGGKISNNQYYRVYGQYADYNSWFRGRGGFRLDGKTGKGDGYSLQANAYGGQQDTTTRVSIFTAPFVQNLKADDDSSGANIVASWKRRFSDKSELSVKGYVDTYFRNEALANQKVGTADLEFQHSLMLSERDNFVWGGGGRTYYQNLTGSYGVSTSERYSTHEVLNLFAQNEHALIPQVLYLTIGSKFEHNDYTGFEVQPSSRLAWHLSPNQMVWGAVSKAVRTPSSIENDVSLLSSVAGTSPPTENRIIGNSDQKAEELIAYELGHRIQVNRDVSVDTTVFYNNFTNLLTISQPGASFVGANGNTIVPYLLSNLGEGTVYGLESAVSWKLSNRWKLGGSYSYLKMDLDVKPGTLGALEAEEQLAPRHQFSVQSYYNLTDAVHWDNMVYYVDDLSGPVEGYVRYDTRVAWLVQTGLEVSLIGRNMLGSHEEFPGTPQFEVDRSLIGQVLWKF